MGSASSKSLISSKSVNSSMDSRTTNNYSPNTTILSLDLSSESMHTEDNNLDPRSPTMNVLRTPITEHLGRKNILNVGVFGISPSTAALKDHDNPKGILKSKIMKHLNKKLIDPRSPNQLINRTPIVFDETTNSSEDDMNKSINLDDTFSDLFITNDNCSSPTNYQSAEENPSELKVNMIGNKENLLIDPRSPSLEIERTPILLSDENIEENDKMIENLIEKIHDEATDKSKKKIKKHKNNYKMLQKKIYEDCNQLYSTPKSNKENSIFPKRTPLSCMGNISHLKEKNTTKPIAKFNFDNLTITKPQENFEEMITQN